MRGVRPNMTNIPGVSELLYATYDLPLHPELFIGARGTRYESKAFLTYLYLMNLGHMAVLFNGTDAICELVAPRDSLIPREGQLAVHYFDSSENFNFAHKGRINYRVTAKVTKMTPVDFFRKANMVILRQSAGRMVQFHQPNREEPLSFSMVDVKNLSDSTIVEAHHFFGRSTTVIRTFSTADRQSDGN